MLSMAGKSSRQAKTEQMLTMFSMEQAQAGAEAQQLAQTEMQGQMVEQEAQVVFGEIASQFIQSVAEAEMERQEPPQKMSIHLGRADEEATVEAVPEEEAVRVGLHSREARQEPL